MIVKPRIRGFICTTAHPKGCAAHVALQIAAVKRAGNIANGPKRVLVIGSSGGYGLASRIVSTFACGADTIGVSFEKQPEGDRTATAGWYNNHAFEAAARRAGRFAETFDGDAFSDAMKARVVERIKSSLGQIDLLVYSVASPVRQHPKTGQLHRSVIKPLGESLRVRTLNVDKGEVVEADLTPATEEETAATVAVMGGEDWELWIDALRSAGALARGFQTVNFAYIGSELTWPIYWRATLGRAKEDLDRAAGVMRGKLASLGGDARVAVLKAVVTQASTAIPVVPLYVSLLFKVMKQQRLHEDLIDHVYRLFATQLYGGKPRRLDESGRMRLDDVELSEPVQTEVKRRWPVVTSANLAELADLEGFRADFLRIFGFGIAGVDYDEDLDTTIGYDA
jgi:enoyl-[acyl-carrier protein] reductase/trans-2-enoyl-CoA reductase (NAD+)